MARLVGRRDGVRDTHFGSRRVLRSFSEGGSRDSKRIGKFAVDVGAWREALDMYPRERRKPANAAKSPARFERNARRMASTNQPISN